MRVVDALPIVRTSRIDLQLTYDADDLALRVGDVVRIPLGSREVLGFIVSDVREESAAPSGIKTVVERYDSPRAFDETGLALARFVAERYVCTLGEALNAVVLAGTVPRVREVLRRVGDIPSGRYPSVPVRLLDLIWDVFDEQFSLATLLRHPDARRVGDRRHCSSHAGALVRGGSLRRVRQIVGGRNADRRISTLWAGNNEPKGRKARALGAFVASRGSVPRAEALLNGFSNAVVRRAVQSRGAARDLGTRGAEHAAKTDGSCATCQASRGAHRNRSRVTPWPFRNRLLHGVTGSGKTFVYVEAILELSSKADAPSSGSGNLADPANGVAFEDAFGDRVAVLSFRALRNENATRPGILRARRVLTSWSALAALSFAPLRNVAWRSSTNRTTPRINKMSCRATMRRPLRQRECVYAQGVLLLGSATPSLESYAAATEAVSGCSRSGRGQQSCRMPEVTIVDLREENESG